MKAATAIANDGKMLQPYVVDKIIDPETGEAIEEKSPNVVGEPISEETAKQVRELLKSVVHGEDGTGKSYQLEDYEVGGKSGTAEMPDPNGGYLNGRENYVFSFLGMAPIDDPELMMYVSVQQPELEYDETGSMPVSFIFTNVMENALHYLSIDPDNEEDGSIQPIEIPTIIGEKTSDIEKMLTDQGIEVTTIGSGDEIVAANVKEDEEVYPNNHVMLVTDEPTMPDIIGWSMRNVVEFADLLELKIEVIGNGYVTKQHIEEGTPLKENDYLGVELEPPVENSEESTEDEEVDEEVENME